ncbi:MAG TPA: carboxylating nicotinate-nucleotide diphosphorylase [Acidimicrobiales bacterium]|nr:carboxylating nicotinate-nucleotide diphosphorylase [Acidimicrobiales bacterium]
MTPVHPPIQAVQDAVRRAIEEDVLPMGDLTAALLDDDERGRGAFVSRAEGVLAGRLCADEAFRQVDPSLLVTWQLDDGDAVSPGSVIGWVEGRLASILTAERTALNFLCHLSGVATLTATYVASVAGRATVLDTRKTTPGLRALEKAAVRAGGGSNHRGSLSEFVLVKDNHLTGMSITDAVERARDAWPARTVEVECDRIEQVKEAVAAGADMVLLDNMDAEDVVECVKAVDGECYVEVSGGVNLETVAALAQAGPDFISVGALTHSAPVLDIGLDLGA